MEITAGTTGAWRTNIGTARTRRLDLWPIEALPGEGSLRHSAVGTGTLWPSAGRWAVRIAAAGTLTASTWALSAAAGTLGPARALPVAGPA